MVGRRIVWLPAPLFHWLINRTTVIFIIQRIQPSLRLNLQISLFLTVAIIAPVLWPEQWALRHLPYDKFTLNIKIMASSSYFITARRNGWCQIINETIIEQLQSKAVWIHVFNLIEVLSQEFCSGADPMGLGWAQAPPSNKFAKELLCLNFC